MLADIESAQARNRPFQEIRTIVENRAKEFMELHSEKSVQGGPGASRQFNLDLERKKDHYSHFVLRLAFCRSFVSLSLSRFFLLESLHDADDAVVAPSPRHTEKN